MSTRDFSWGKGSRCIRLTTYHPCGAKTSRKSGALTYPKPLGPRLPVAGDLYFYFTCNAMYRLLVLRRFRVQISPLQPHDQQASLLFVTFLTPSIKLQGLLPQIILQLFPFTSPPILHTLAIVPFQAVPFRKYLFVIRCCHDFN